MLAPNFEHRPPTYSKGLMSVAKTEPFAFIPEHTLLSEGYKRLGRSSKLLFVYLALRRKGVDRSFTYSYKEIKGDSGQTYNTIAKSIRELAEAGFVEYEHGGLELNPNRYYIPSGWLNLL